MLQHNHIDTRARPPGSCPSCSSLWQELEVVQLFYNLEYELETARVYLQDYGEKEMLQHLTATRDRAQMVKHQIDRSREIPQ